MAHSARLELLEALAQSERGVERLARATTRYQSPTLHIICRACAPTRRFIGDGTCFLETGDGRADYGAGNFYAKPLPEMEFRSLNFLRHGV